MEVLSEVRQPKYDEYVRIRIDVSFVFNKDDIDFDKYELDTVRAMAVSRLSRMNPKDIRRTVVFESSADVYYHDNMGIETEL